jgi:hypothetical protein
MQRDDLVGVLPRQIGGFGERRDANGEALLFD